MVDFITQNPATVAYDAQQRISDEELARRQQQDQIQRGNTIQNATLPTQLRQMTAGADLAQTNANVAQATAPARISEAGSNAAIAGVNAQYAAPEAQGRLRQLNASASNSEMEKFVKEAELLGKGDPASLAAAKASDPNIPDALLQDAEIRGLVASAAVTGKQIYANRPDDFVNYMKKTIADAAQKRQQGLPVNPPGAAYTVPGAPQPQAFSYGTGRGMPGGVTGWKYDAWLAAHPNDTAGALEYAGGRKQMSQPEIIKSALSMASSEFQRENKTPKPGEIEARANEIAHEIAAGQITVPQAAPAAPQQPGILQRLFGGGSPAPAPAAPAAPYVAPGPVPQTGAPNAPPTTAAPQPPMDGAKQAPDGNWYVPDPNRPGKYLRVDQ